MTNTIKEFLEEWKESARSYYEEMAQLMIDTDRETFNEEYSRAQRETFRIAYNKQLFEEFLNKQVAIKEEKLIKTIEKKAGKIIDASHLTIGKDGSINGEIIGEKETVQVETIYAGGYNIRRLHYRTLVKVI